MEQHSAAQLCPAPKAHMCCAALEEHTRVVQSSRQAEMCVATVAHTINCADSLSSPPLRMFAACALQCGASKLKAQLTFDRPGTAAVPILPHLKCLRLSRALLTFLSCVLLLPCSCVRSSATREEQ